MAGEPFCSDPTLPHSLKSLILELGLGFSVQLN
jgi:hypothetical protein